MQKQRVFQAEMLLAKNGGLAPTVEKRDFPREKRDRYGFTPLKPPGFLLKRSQTMRIHAETTRIQSQTAHKASIEHQALPKNDTAARKASNQQRSRRSISCD
jgi:hypothetical protein